MMLMDLFIISKTGFRKKEVDEKCLKKVSYEILKTNADLFSR